MRAHKQNVAKFLKDLGGTITTTGSANAHAATLNQPIATTVPTGFAFKVKWGYTNTSTTVNLNINSIGNARVKVNYGGILADPIPGDIQAGAYGDIIFDGTYHVLLNPQQRAPYPSGHLYGLTLSNNGSDATNDIDIAVGTARSSDDSANIDLTSAITKRLDAAWAVGTGNGGLDTGSIADTTYHVWLIKRPDTGVVDVLFSTSASSPTMPSNYTLKRRIGSILRESGAIVAFRQNGDFFRRTPVANYSSTSSRAAALLALSVPIGIVVRPVLLLNLTPSAGAAIHNQLGDAAVGNISLTVQEVFNDGTSAMLIDQFYTNTSGQLYFAVDIIAGTIAANAINTYGWHDPRGRE